MNVDEFINKFYNEAGYKESIQSELLNLKSSFSKEEIQEHKEQIKELISNLSQKETNEGINRKTDRY